MLVPFHALYKFVAGIKKKKNALPGIFCKERIPASKVTGAIDWNFLIQQQQQN
jgi:hypothetical protein